MLDSGYCFVSLLQAWTNCRMHVVKHRVMVSREKDRYSLGAFAIPVESTIIKATKELVDGQYPQVLKDYGYMDFATGSIQWRESSLTQTSKCLHLQDYRTTWRYYFI